MKCALETRTAYEHLRKANTLTCRTCTSQSIPSNTPNCDSRRTALPFSSNSQLNILQWNSDFLAPKITELATMVKKMEVYVVLLEDTKLGSEDLIRTAMEVAPNITKEVDFLSTLGKDCLTRSRIRKIAAQQNYNNL